MGSALWCDHGCRFFAFLHSVNFLGWLPLWCHDAFEILRHQTPSHNCILFSFEWPDWVTLASFKSTSAWTMGVTMMAYAFRISLWTGNGATLSEEWTYLQFCYRRLDIGAHWVCHGVLNQRVPDFKLLRPISTIKGVGRELAIGLPIFYFYLVKTFENLPSAVSIISSKEHFKSKEKNQFNKFSIIKPCSLFPHFSYLKLGNHSFGQLWTT